MKTYGAVGDGVTDDTAAIQAALNDLKNVVTNNWSVLYFPAGTYQITQQLTTSRSAHSDYLGAQLIGEDPNTTIIRWAGASGGTMLRWDAWYDKVSRFTFDGQSSAYLGLVRAGAFSTYSEVSDLIMEDMTGACIDLGNGEGEGIAEELITRNRFYRCGLDAIATWNYNTLDIYIWHNYFEDNNIGIRNATGAFHVYDNRFVRSKVTDLNSVSNMISSVVNNVSLNSRSFVGNAQNIGWGAFEANPVFQGNEIYGATDLAFDLTDANPVVMIDNLVQGPDGSAEVAVNSNSDGLFDGNTFVTSLSSPFASAPAGNVFLGQQTIVSASSIEAPTSLSPFDFESTRESSIVEVLAFTGDAIQAAIDQAAAMTPGSNPIVHLPKGIYTVASTISVPAGLALTIVGDGASENGSRLDWSGNSGPVMWLHGPSRAVLHDFHINTGSAGGDGLLIDAADQAGGRIYGYEVEAGGSDIANGHGVDAAFDISGLEQTHLDFNASGFDNFFSGVRASDGSTHVQFLTGASGLGQCVFGVNTGASLIGTGYWYEGEWSFTAPLLDEPTGSSGNIAIASMQWAAGIESLPLVRTQSFSGAFTLLASALNFVLPTSPGPWMSFAGDGGGSNILSSGNQPPADFDATALSDIDQTSPAGLISQINIGSLPPFTNKLSGTQPTQAFITNQLALMRTIDTSQATAGPAGVTDVKILRVIVGGGDNHIAVKVTGQ